MGVSNESHGFRVRAHEHDGRSMRPSCALTRKPCACAAPPSAPQPQALCIRCALPTRPSFPKNDRYRARSCARPVKNISCCFRTSCPQPPIVLPKIRGAILPDTHISSLPRPHYGRWKMYAPTLNCTMLCLPSNVKLHDAMSVLNTTSVHRQHNVGAYPTRRRCIPSPTSVHRQRHLGAYLATLPLRSERSPLRSERD